MSHNSSIQQLNRDSIAFIHQDGLLDIFLGFGILYSGLGIFSGMPWLAGVYPAIFLPLWQVARRKITISRIGDISSSALVRARAFIWGIIGLALGLLVFTMFAGGIAFNSFDLIPQTFLIWIKQYSLLILGGVFVGLFCLSALLFKLNRLYFYGLLTAVIFLAGFWFEIDFAWQLTLLGGIIFTVGLVYLQKFTNRYPKKL